MKDNWKAGDKFYWNGCCRGYYTILARAGDMILFDHFPKASCSISDIYKSEEEYKKARIEVLNKEIQEREEEIKILSTSEYEKI